MKLRILITIATCFALGGFQQAQLDDVALTTVSHGWKASEDDNICGISDLKKVSRPSQVDYEKVLEATPQMKKIKDKDIDPESAEGKALRKAAQTLITKSAEAVRKSKSSCSVWKSISHSDGRTIPDVTEDVIERF